MNYSMLRSLVILFVFAFLQDLYADGVEFRHIQSREEFNAVLKDAKDSDRLVMLDFWADWCGPCKRLDKLTWPNERVAAWVEKNAIPVKMDIATAKEAGQSLEGLSDEQIARVKEVQLARELFKEFWGTSIPDVIFIVPDEDAAQGFYEFARLSGFKDADKFMSEVDFVFSFKTRDDYLNALREQLLTGDRNSIYRSAAVLFRDQVQKLGDEPSAEEVDAAAATYFEYANISRGFESMVARNQPLKAKLQETFSTYPGKIRDGSITDDEFSMFMETARREKDKTPVIEIVREQVNSETPVIHAESEKLMLEYLFEDYDVRNILIKEEQYELLSHFDTTQRDATRFERISKFLDGEILSDLFVTEEERTGYLHSMVSGIAESYKILKFTDRTQQANELIDTYKSTVPVEMQTAGDYNSFAWDGYESGRVTALDEELARKAYELSEGKDPMIVDTLVRVLWKRGKTPEAISLVNLAKEASISNSDRAMLDACLRDFREE